MVSTLPLWFRANSVAFRCSRCGFARVPLQMLPLWFRANSGLSWPLQASSGGGLRLPTATARAVRRVLGFDAPAVVSREFRCVSMLPLWFRANSVAFRCSRCGFARVPASSGLFWGGHLGCRPQRRAVGRVLGFDAPAVVSREFRCVSMLPLWFRPSSVADAPPAVSREFRPLVASSGLFWGGHLGCRPHWRARWDGSLVSMLPLGFRANSVAFRCSRCGFARIPLHFDAPAAVASSGRFWGRDLGCRPQFLCVSMLPLWFRANSVAFRCSRLWFRAISGLSWPLQASSPHYICCRPQRQARWDGALVSTLPLWFRANSVRFDAAAVVSREFRCISMLPLWFRANSGLSWPLQASLGGATWVADRTGARGGTGPWFRCSRCGFARIPLRFDAPAVVSREFRCISMLPLSFRANSGLSWPLQASSGGAT